MNRLQASLASKTRLSPLALTCIQQRIEPDMLDMMATQYREAALQIRASGLARMGGQA